MPAFRSRLSSCYCVGLAIAVMASVAAPPVDVAWAQTANSEEESAFQATKELGTADAWNAFIANYPDGFRADLARAYLKKLSDQPAAAAPAIPQPAQSFDYPMVAGSWGGIVRSGPGQDTARVASLKEGEEVTLMAPPIPVTPNDYPWFKIAFGDGQIGYMWGGLLCSTGAERPDLFKLCTFTPVRGTAAPAIPQERPTKRRDSSSVGGGGGKPTWCGSAGSRTERAICSNSDLLSLDSVLNTAYRRAKFDSPGSKQEIEQGQKRWIGQRNLCGGDAGCIQRRYDEQIGILESYFAN